MSAIYCRFISALIGFMCVNPLKEKNPECKLENNYEIKIIYLKLMAVLNVLFCNFPMTNIFEQLNRM